MSKLNLASLGFRPAPNADELSEEYAIIPRRTLGAIQRYYERGDPMGSFLEAVLSNDLFDACNRGDKENLAALPAIVMLLHCRYPSIIWGSPEKYKNWLKSHQIGELQE